MLTSQPEEVAVPVSGNILLWFHATEAGKDACPREGFFNAPPPAGDVSQPKDFRFLRILHVAGIRKFTPPRLFEKRKAPYGKGLATLLHHWVSPNTWSSSAGHNLFVLIVFILLFPVTYTSYQLQGAAVLDEASSS